MDEHGHEEGESLWEATVEVVTDPPHIASEIIMEGFSYLIFGLLIAPFVKRWVRRHDLQHHGHDCDSAHATKGV